MRFELDDKQKELLSKWMAKKDLSKYEGASGGRFEFCFCQTSVGMAVTVKDHIDKDQLNLSCMEDW